MASVRGVVSRVLPESVVDLLKRIHYRRALPSLVEEESDIWIARRFAKPGATVLDIGANIGVYTYALSKAVGTAGRVIAFEPVGKSYDFLRGNISAHSLANVSAFNIALSDHDGAASMRIPKFKAGGSNFYQARIVDEEQDAGSPESQAFCAVHLTTLDSFIAAQALPAPSFIKIDVEGHEYHVIRGAERTIDSAKPTLFIEISGNPNDPASAAGKLIGYLEGIGYSTFTVRDGQMHARGEGLSSINYLFLHGQPVSG